MISQGKVTATTSTPFSSSENHQELAYVSLQSGGPPFHSTIWVYDFDTARQKFLFEIDEAIGSLQWSPDGKYLLFISTPDQYQFRSRIYIVDAAGKLIYKGRSDMEGDAAWSPDSQYVAFESYRQSSNEIMTMRFDGTKQRQLTSDTYEDYMSVWSPDGKQLAYWSRRDGPDGEIYVISATGFNRRRLTHDNMGNTSPVWSKDGKSIYFVSGEGISAMDSTGANPRLVTTLDVNDRYIEGFTLPPRLSPDGTKILFTRRAKGIYLVNSDGTNDHVLVDTRDATAPAWSLDGQYVAYEDTIEGYTTINLIKVMAQGKSK